MNTVTNLEYEHVPVEYRVYQAEYVFVFVWLRPKNT